MNESLKQSENLQLFCKLKDTYNEKADCVSGVVSASTAHKTNLIIIKYITVANTYLLSNKLLGYKLMGFWILNLHSLPLF